MASKENVEKVVKAPRIPTVRNFCIGSFDIENKLKLSIVIPIKNEPNILMRRMPQGKFVPNIIEIWFARKYLSNAPNAPPIAIEITVINVFP